MFVSVRSLDGSRCDSGPESSSGSSGYEVSGDSHDSYANNSDSNRYDVPKWPPIRIANNADSYDVPRPINSVDTLSPSSSVSSLAYTNSDSMSGSNRSSIAPDYDVPRSRPLSFDRQQENRILVIKVAPFCPFFIFSTKSGVCKLTDGCVFCRRTMFPSVCHNLDSCPWN